MITKLRAFADFWYDFIVGDDWRVAAGVVAALALTTVLSRTTQLPVWLVGVVAVAVILPLSIYRVARGKP